MFCKTIVRGLLAAIIVVPALSVETSNAASNWPLYESDSFSNNVFTFTSSGTQSIFVNGFQPTGLAFDGNGNLFVADYNGTYTNPGYIYKITPSGSRSTFASGLHGPQGLAFDSSGNLFEADSNVFGVGTINEFTPGGVQSTFASGLSDPIALAFSSSGNLYVTNYFSGVINEFTPSGVISTFASGLNYPQGLAFDANGNLFEADGGSGNIYEFTPGGVRSTFASGFVGGYNTGPSALAFDSDGNLFVGDINSESIYKFAQNGSRTLFASGLDLPNYLAFAPSAVPEPSTVALLIAGAVGLLAFAWRKMTHAT